jgi:sporulation protein YlmC with PRC-barrel domain
VTVSLLLSDCLRLLVREDSGNSLGRLAEIVVEGSERFPRAFALIVRTRSEDIIVPWRAVDRISATHAIVRTPIAPMTLPAGRPALRLARDVLDAQVVDLAGRRLARVGDVELAERDGVLRAVAVDVSLAPVARRLGLRRLAARLREDWIGWDGIYIASGRGHRLQVDHRAAEIHRLDHDELMALVARLPPERGAEVLDTARPGAHADPLAAARRARRPRRHFRVMRARKRAPS